VEGLHQLQCYFEIGVGEVPGGFDKLGDEAAALRVVVVGLGAEVEKVAHRNVERAGQPLQCHETGQGAAALDVRHRRNRPIKMLGEIFLREATPQPSELDPMPDAAFERHARTVVLVAKACEPTVIAVGWLPTIIVLARIA